MESNLTSDLRTVHSDLIKLAAELVRGEGVPDWSDHKFYRSTPNGERREIMEALRYADEALRNYGVRLKAIADKLSEQIPPPPPTICGTPCEGSIKGTCTEPRGHTGHHWFPNMWSDM